jgi:hypothetical protein
VRAAERVGAEARDLAPCDLDLGVGQADRARPRGEPAPERRALLGGARAGERAAEQVAAAERRVGEGRDRAHHVLLVEQHALLRREQRVQARMDRARRLEPALDAHVQVLHARARGPGADERERGNRVVERLRIHHDEQVPHAGRLELEEPERVAPPQHRDRLRVPVGHGLEARHRARHVRDVGGGVADLGQRAVAEQVHLDEAERLDLPHFHLRDDESLGRLLERRVVGQRGVGDDEPARVDAEVVGEPGEPRRVAQRATERRLLEVEPERAAGGQEFRAAASRGRAHELRDAVDHVRRNPVRLRRSRNAPARAGVQWVEIMATRSSPYVRLDVRDHVVARIQHRSMSRSGQSRRSSCRSARTRAVAQGIDVRDAEQRSDDRRRAEPRPTDGIPCARAKPRCRPPARSRRESQAIDHLELARQPMDGGARHRPVRRARPSWQRAYRCE